MSAAAVTDAAVRHFLENVSGIKAAYGSGQGNQTGVRTFPSSITDSPVAILEVGTLRMSVDPESFERTTWSFTVNVWINAADAPWAVSVVVPLFDAIRDSFRSNVQLFGTCQWATATTAGPPDPQEVNGVPYLVLPVNVSALEFTVTQYTPGGS